MILRGTAAVIGGIAVYSLLLFGATWVGDELFGRNESELINAYVMTQVLWLLWNFVSIAVAGYAVASIARRTPVAAAIAMGAVQALFTLGAMLTTHLDITPQWLWIGVIVATIPGAWMGARLRSNR